MSEQEIRYTINQDMTGHFFYAGKVKIVKKAEIENYFCVIFWDETKNEWKEENILKPDRFIFNTEPEAKEAVRKLNNHGKLQGG